MKDIIKLLLLIMLFSSCKKRVEEKNCIGTNCAGNQTVYLEANDKTYIPIKDTVYKFININNDTIFLRHRKSNTEFYRTIIDCDCADKSTIVSGELFYSTYIMDNLNRALECSVGAIYLNNSYLCIDCSDTNAILHKINTKTSPFSQFLAQNYASKKNDADSININGKYYYNIINTYDYGGFSDSLILRGIYYSKGFGIVRFKYNNLDYSIIH